MKVTQLKLDGVSLIDGVRHQDARGWFEETWSAPRLAAAGFHKTFVQDNVSFSNHRGTLRGLHCQKPPFAQGKLVGVLKGAILDVAVDARPNSATYRQSLAVELDAGRPQRLYIPAGFLHGFITLEPETVVHYKVTAPYSRDHDCVVAWDDPDLAIEWGTNAPILSDKDAAAPRLKDTGPLFEGISA